MVLTVYSLLTLTAALLPWQPPLSVTLGETNVEQGLSVASHGDGLNHAAVYGDVSCREVDGGAGSSMMYVDVLDGYDPPGEVYVTVEYLDLQGTIDLQYDARGGHAYTQAPGAVPQEGSGEWRQATFTLRGSGFGDRQNGETDFRLHTSGRLVVRQITLTEEPPAGYQPAPDPARYFADRAALTPPTGMTVIQQWQVHLPLEEAKLRPEPYRLARHMGITSLQSYVTWRSIEPEQGAVTFEVYDPVVEQIRAAGIGWLPFIILGPYYATPQWWRDQHGVSCVSLEQGDLLPIQSIWNPALRPAVERFLGLFAQHYGEDAIEALNLGISGNWGESIMPAGGGFELHNHPVYKTHAGWWCGDEYARADWRRWVAAAYGGIEAVNAAWGAEYPDLDAIEPFVPSEAPSRRAAVDLVNWYSESMTDLAEYWVASARELYPDKPIYLCTGGSGEPMLGADFAAQARMCARYGAGIRITNESDDAAMNFAVTRLVSSATRLYGGYYTTEPGGANSPQGIAGRVFDAVSGGARGVYFKTLITDPDRPSEQAVRLAENMHRLVPYSPQLTVAVLWPDCSIVLDGTVLNRFLSRVADLRDVLDVEFVSESMVRDGLLDSFSAAVIVSGDTFESSTLEALEGWVRRGGTLFCAQDSLPLLNVEGEPVEWMPAAPAEAPAPILAQPIAEPGVLVDVGGRDDRFLMGAWHAPEGAHGGAASGSFRWTAGDARVLIPTPAGESPLVVEVDLEIPAAAGQVSVSVNGVPVAAPMSEGGALSVQVPEALVGDRTTLVVGIESDTWRPSELMGAQDDRALGVQVRSVAARRDAEAEPVDAATLALDVGTDLSTDLPPCVTQWGEGWLVAWPGDWWSTRAMLAQALTASPPETPWERIAEPIGAPSDEVLHCRVGDEIYSYNNGSQAVTVALPDGQSVEVPGYGLVVTPQVGRATQPAPAE